MTRRWSYAAAVIAAGLLLTMYFTAYRPVLYATERLAVGEEFFRRGEILLAEQAWQSAADSDPFAARPWRELVGLRHRRWLTTRSPEDFDRFTAAAEQMLARDRRSSNAAWQYAHWLFDGFRASGDDRPLLDSAIEWYDRVLELYPNYNRGHAQRAWALHLSGDAEGASRAANQALRLDEQNPHDEQKLVKFQMDDPGPARTGGRPGPAGRDAEQWMRELRNGEE